MAHTAPGLSRWGRSLRAAPHPKGWEGEGFLLPLILGCFLARRWCSENSASPHWALVFSSYNKEPLASLSRLWERGSYHRLPLTTALCYLTLLVMGTTQAFLRRGSEAQKHRPENNKLAPAICINQLRRVPRGEGCLPRMHVCTAQY